MRIFWSWQSDTPQATGRHFVRDVLAELAKDLNGVDGADDAERPDEDGVSAGDAQGEDDEYLLADDGRVEIDHDTFGVGGSPRIADTILEKIRAAAVFVADVTPIRVTKSGKKVPNPNVMIELGYAMSVLEHERITLVMNIAEGAGLKYLPFDLRHWRAPVTYSLRKGANEDEVKTAAAAVKADLRRRIVPGLRKAADAQKADHRQTTRAPEFSISVAGQDQVWAVSQTVDLQSTVKGLAEVRAETPLLPLPPSPDPRFGIATQPAARPTATFPDFAPARSPELWTREETEGYNSRVEHYHAAYARFLDEYAAWLRLSMRSREIQLRLSNIGTASASNIDVEVEFPSSIALYKNGDHFPEEPVPPKPPEQRPIPRGVAYAVSGVNEDVQPIDFHSLSNTMIDPEEGRVYLSVDSLKHNTAILSSSFIISIASGEDIATFDAEFVLTANEPIDPIRGLVHFDVLLIS